MLFESRRSRRVRTALAQPFPITWRMALHRAWPAWSLLGDGDRARLEPMIQQFVASKRWEAAQGFDVSDEMRALVAAQACLLVLELGLECLDGVSTILVHQKTVVLHGQRATGAHGLASSD